MYSNSFDLQAINGEREELVARYRRERAGLRAASHPFGARVAIARVVVTVVRPLRLRRRSAGLADAHGAEAGRSNPAIS